MQLFEEETSAKDLRRRLKVALTACLFSASVLVNPSSIATATGVQSLGKTHVLQGNISRDVLVDALEKVGIKVIIRDGTPITLAVDKVQMGTAAFYQGVDKGDIIKHINQTPTRLILAIQRGGSTYQVSLKLPDDMPDLHAGAARTDVLQGLAKQTALSAGVNKDQSRLGKEKAKLDLAQVPVPVVDVTQHDIPVKNVGQAIPQVDVNNREKEKVLIKYDLEVIVDISGSMNAVDGTGDISKFEWCHRQVRALAQKMAPYGKTLTITTFNASYDVMPHCTAQKIEQVYADTTPAGFTDLVDPLVNRLEANLPTHDAKHPLLVAVITDGMPNRPVDPKAVDRALIDFTQQMHSPGQVVITFLQIGDTFDGKDFCRNLDDNLVREGAKYDIVDTKTFDQLKEEGLVNALIDAVIENEKYGALPANEKHLARFTNSIKSAGDPQTNKDLNQLQEDRHAIERQILER